MTHNDVVTPSGNLQPQEGVPVYTRTEHVHDTISSSQTRAPREQQRIVEEQVASTEATVDTASAPNIFENAVPNWPQLISLVLEKRDSRICPDVIFGGHDSGGWHSAIDPETSASLSPLRRRISEPCATPSRGTAAEGRTEPQIAASQRRTTSTSRTATACADTMASIPVQIIWVV